MLMFNGFYQELEKLKSQDLSITDFGFLENIKVGEYFYLYDFLHGHCDEFAAALSDFYGYEIEYFIGNDNVLIHAYCTVDVNNVKAYIDVRGITTNAELFWSEFADFCTYKSGLLFDLSGKCQVIKHKDTKEMYNDKNRELNQDKDLVEFFKTNNLYYDINSFEKEIKMKTYKDWPEGTTITQYLQIGDKIDTELYQHFLNILPPHFQSSGMLQVGGSCDIAKNENGVLDHTYITFVMDNESDCWIFKGECCSGELINRNPELEPTVDKLINNAKSRAEVVPAVEVEKEMEKE